MTARRDDTRDGRYTIHCDVAGCTSAWRTQARDAWGALDAMARCGSCWGGDSGLDVCGRHGDDGCDLWPDDGESAGL